MRPVHRRSRPVCILVELLSLEVVISHGLYALVVGLMLRLVLDLFAPSRAVTCRISGLLQPGSGHRFTNRCDPPACCYCRAVKP